MGKHALRSFSRWPRRLLLAWVLASIGVGLLGTAGVLGLTGWAAGSQRSPSVGIVPPAQPPPSVGGVLPAQSLPPAARQVALAMAIPTRLMLPLSKVNAPVVPVTVLPDGGLDVPDDPHMLGWWRDGAHPGSQTGTVVIVGHVDTARDGAGALFQLSRARPGQRVALDTNEGSRRYVITALRSYSKADLPAEVFARAGRARLVIITCGGEFSTETRQYTDNVVAYAVPD